MKLSHILNVIVIILILHLIIINVDSKKTINFSNEQIMVNPSEEYSKDVSKSENLEEFYQKPPQDELLDFINSDVLPSNSYSSKNNDSNFQSDIMPTKDFYEIEKDIQLKKPIEQDGPLNYEDKFSDYLECENIEQNQQTNITDLRAGKDQAIYHNPI